MLKSFVLLLTVPLLIVISINIHLMMLKIIMHFRKKTSVLQQDTLLTMY